MQWLKNIFSGFKQKKDNMDATSILSNLAGEFLTIGIVTIAYVLIVALVEAMILYYYKSFKVEFLKAYTVLIIVNIFSLSITLPLMTMTIRNPIITLLAIYLITILAEIIPLQLFLPHVWEKRFKNRKEHYRELLRISLVINTATFLPTLVGYLSFIGL